MDHDQKCLHGIYNPDAPAPARYCGICTPNANDRTLQGLPKFKQHKAGIRDARPLRVDEFLAQPMGARLAAARLEEAA